MPFHDDRSVDCTGARRLLECIIDKGLHGTCDRLHFCVKVGKEGDHGGAELNFKREYLPSNDQSEMQKLFPQADNQGQHAIL